MPASKYTGQLDTDRELISQRNAILSIYAEWVQRLQALSTNSLQLATDAVVSMSRCCLQAGVV